MVFAILKALSRAIKRDLATFESVKVNNFFLFVALLIYGALESGVRPSSAEPFLLFLGFLLLFPLSSDPLDKIPPQRLASLAAPRAFSDSHCGWSALGLSPVLWQSRWRFCCWRPRHARPVLPGPGGPGSKG